MSDLRVTTVQISMYWEQKNKNLQKYSDLINPLKGLTDLIILPEMFTTGFSMRSEELAETMDGPSVQWMKTQASMLNAAITGSLIIRENESIYNRLIFAKPDGSIATYDKRHLFGMGDEHNNYAAGLKKLIVEYKSWRICPLVCYDLRFPVWSRNIEDYDLLIYVANWPSKRKYAWRTLLFARAIENQCYVIGVNRVGLDANNFNHSGDTVIIPPMGYKPLYEISDSEEVHTESLDLDAVKSVREKLPFLKDRDGFEITS